FALSQFLFLVPALLIAAPLLWPGATATGHKADAVDRRIVTLLAFGPMLTVLALSALSGRGTIAMWGYPLWLFLGVWIVLHWRQAIEVRRAALAVGVWVLVSAGFALTFIANYGILPNYDGRERAVLLPGERLGREIYL